MTVYTCAGLLKQGQECGVASPTRVAKLNTGLNRVGEELAAPAHQENL